MYLVPPFFHFRVVVSLKKDGSLPTLPLKVFLESNPTCTVGLAKFLDPCE